MPDKIFTTKPIEYKPFLMSSVEIIIPFHNQQSKVINLINDIFLTVQKNRYVVTLVDDGSSYKDFTQHLKERKIDGLRYLKHENCRGFGASINTALANPFRKDINYVAILHSDVRISDPNWLFNMGQSLENMKESGVKMISSICDNPTVDEPILKGQKGVSRNDAILKDGFLPMYCVLSHRELFSRVGGMKEYPYAGIEVDEFARRMKKMNYLQGVCGKSWVSHEGRGTLSQYDDDKKVQEILRNARNDFNKSNKN
jgi:GT2 family glycosyltransferase